MYCSNCGTQISDDANFCFKCGQQQSSRPLSVNQKTSANDWEYWTWEAEPPKGMDLGHPKKDGGLTEFQARLHFWQKIQSRVLPAIQQLRDDGWEPITEVGPSAIKLDTKFRKEDGAVDWSKFLKDTGKVLIFGSPGWTCYGLSIQFRRQRGSGKSSVNEITKLIAKAGY